MTEFTGAENLGTPVWRQPVPNITMADGGTTEGTAEVVHNGIIGTIVVVLPNSTNGVTATFAIRDEDGYELYSVSGLADSTTHVKTGVDILVAGKLTIGLKAGGDPGADWTSTKIIFCGV